MGYVIPISQCIIPPALSYSCCIGGVDIEIVQVAENSLIAIAKGLFNTAAFDYANWSITSQSTLMEQPCLMVYDAVKLADNSIQFYLTQELRSKAPYTITGSSSIFTESAGQKFIGVSKAFIADAIMKHAIKDTVPLLDFDSPLTRNGVLIADIVENSNEFSLAGGNETIRKIVAAILSGEYFRVIGEPVPYSYKELMIATEYIVLEQEIFKLPHIVSAVVTAEISHNKDTLTLIARVTTDMGSFVQSAEIQNG